MILSDDELYSIFRMIKAHVKDEQIDVLERNMLSVQSELITAEAQARREKNVSIIKNMHTINIKLIEVRNSYSKIHASLNEETCNELEAWIKSCEKRRQNLAKKKF